MQFIQAHGYKVTRVDPFLKKEVTDFIDGMMKQKIVFLDVHLKDWVLMLEFLHENKLKLLICGEDFSVYEKIEDYLLAKAAHIPTDPKLPQHLTHRTALPPSFPAV